MKQTLSSLVLQSANSTLQINAIHYPPNHIPKSHQLPLPINQNFQVRVANQSSFIPKSELLQVTLVHSVGAGSQSMSQSLSESHMCGAAAAALDPSTLILGCAAWAGRVPTSSWWETPPFRGTNWFLRGGESQ